MKIKNFILIFIILLFISQIIFGQENYENRNWYKDTKGFDNFYSSYEFGRRYTKDNIEEAIGKYHFIKSFTPTDDEWEGIYTSDSMLGYLELFWNSEGGYVKSYYYHTLSSIDYGDVKNQTDSVEFISRKNSSNDKKSAAGNNLIKVKYGDRHYLVPENLLEKFTEMAVGLTDDFSEDKFYYYKVSDEKKEIYGTPILPDKYKKFKRYPVKANIIEVSQPKLEQNKFEDGTVYSEYVTYTVTLNAGSNNKIKKDFRFFAEEINEWITIKKVSPTTSVGSIIRYLDKDRLEICTETEEVDSPQIPCTKIKVGLSAATKNNSF